jgi:primosomal protein N'
MILGFIFSKEGKLSDVKKIQAIVSMPPPNNPQQIQLFNWMTQFYICFIKTIIATMAPITKLTRKIETFLWTNECQKAWELIKQKYIKHRY